MIGACLDQIYTRNTQIKNSTFEVKFDSVCLSDHDPVFYNKKLENAFIKADNCLYIHRYIHKCLLLIWSILQRLTLADGLFSCNVDSNFD